METTTRFTALAWFCVRIVLALILAFAVYGLLRSGTPPDVKTKPWIAADAPSLIPTVVYAVVLGVAALALLAGWQVPLTVTIVSVTLIAVAVERLARNPFTNLTADVLIILVFGLALVVAGPERDRIALDAFRRSKPLLPADRWSIVTLFLRLLVGAIFLWQGIRNVFLGPGPIVFAERLYVKPFAGTLPEPLLWIAGVANPFLQLVVGALLIAGIFTRSAASLGALFLVTIIFGHLLEGGLTAVGAMRDFATANFVVMIAIMIVASLGNRWSVDHLLERRRSRS